MCYNVMTGNVIVKIGWVKIGWVRRWLLVATLLFILAGCRQFSRLVEEGRGQDDHEAELSLIGSDTSLIQLGEADAGTVNLSLAFVDTMSQKLQTRFCGGTYIDDGIILTAKHCLQDDDEYQLAKVSAFFSHGNRKVSHYSGIATAWQLYIHPVQDLVLMSFDVRELNATVPTVQLFELPPGVSTHDQLYKNVRLFARNTNEGSRKRNLYYTRTVDDLYIISQDGDLWEKLNYIMNSNLHPIDKTRFVIRYVLDVEGGLCERVSTHPPADHQLNTWCDDWFKSLLKRDSLFVVGTTLSHLQELKVPRDVLFCAGDSGSGLRLDDGRLVGVLVSFSSLINRGVIFDGVRYLFDPELIRQKRCSSMVFGLNLALYLPWIKATIIQAQAEL